MNDQQALMMMQRCLFEIESLRRHQERNQPKADAYDLLAKILSYIPSPQGCRATEDVTHILRSEIERLEKRPASNG